MWQRGNGPRTAGLCAAALLLALTVALPARGQNAALPPPPAAGAAGGGDTATKLGGLLSGGAHPLSLKLKELGSEWRRMNVVGQLDLGGYTQLLSSVMSTLLGSVGNAVYYTRGDVVTMGGETYIVAYRPQIKGLDIAGLIKEAAQDGGAGAKAPNFEKLLSEKLVPEKLTPETTLSLSLLNLRTSGTLADIRAFDLQREIEEAPKGIVEAVLDAIKGQQPTDPSLRSLQALGAALTAYAEENDGMLPPMNSAAAVQEHLAEHIDDEAAFVHPETKAAYLPNPALSRKRMASVARYAEWMVAFYEASPAPDGTRGVVRLDGSVKRLSEAQWQGAKRASKIP